MTQIESLPPGTRFSRSSDMVFSEVDGDITLMHVESGNYYALTRVGAAIWGLLDEPITLQELCETLMRRYRVGPDQCREEVAALLDRLLAEGLVEPAT